MKNFRASEAIFVCDECGDEVKVIGSEYHEHSGEYELDLECRNCGPLGIDFIQAQGTNN